VDRTVRFGGATVKELQLVWREAVQRGQPRLIRHVSALVYLGDGLSVADVAARVGVSRTTVSICGRT
jgi:DNA-binding transcriptional regulator GbsR (MarR family)